MKTHKRLQTIIDQAVADSFKNGQVDKQKINHFVKYFKSVPSKVLAIELLQMYLDLLKLKMIEGSLQIESAIPLTSKQQTEIEDFIKSSHIIYNTKVAVNPALLGGMRIQIGDKVYENTINQQIEEIGAIIHG